MPSTSSTSTRRHGLVAARRLWWLVLLLVAGCSISKRVGYEDRPIGPDGPPAIGGTAARSVVLRVALDEQLPRQRFTCTGPYRLASGEPDGDLVGLAGGDSTSAWCLQGRVMFANALRGGRADRLILEPESDDDFMVWNGHRWRGALHVIACPADSATVTVINVVDLESYAAGVVPLEIGRGLAGKDRAAVEAQAIAARTYAVSRLDARRSFDLYADTRDQVYGGVDVEDPLADAAVAATGGLVLRHDGELAATFFHANCGGHTAAKETVWPVAPDPLLRGTKDQRPDGRPWCADGSGAQWRQQWSWAELSEVLKTTLPAYLRYVSAPSRAAWAEDAFSPSTAGATGAYTGILHDLRVARTNPDGRVGELEVVTANGIYRVRGGRIRWVLRAARGNSALLRSTMFDLEIDRGRGVTAVGRGYGHGLGLCQDGALARARAGQDARAILEHYYPGAHVVALSASDLP